MIDETKLALCKKLYIEHGGINHKYIQAEMREAGYKRFNTRCLYRSNGRPGWVERFGWRAEVPRYISRASLAVQGYKTVEQYNYCRAKPRKARRALDPASFRAWLERVTPGWRWDWQYQQLIYRQLERVTSGASKRLMIFLPPRHGKSELVTVRYAAWRLKRDPSLNIILGSYNQKLANRFSRKIRNVLRDVPVQAETRAVARVPADLAQAETRSAATLPADPTQAETRAVARVPPETHSAPRRANTNEEWETPEGGGVRAVGAGAGITGYGARLVIIDDPVKNRAEAESPAFRDRVWDWFNDDIYTRLEPGASMILIQTRWHEDDLAGRLLKEMEDGGEHWDVISLPALAEEVDSNAETQRRGETETCSANRSIDPKLNDRIENAREETIADLSSPRLRVSALNTSIDILGRLPGEALCPERFDVKALERIRRKLGSYSFAALYQQRPAPLEGGLFKRKWFRIVDKAPAGLRWKRGYDLAVSTKTSADYTASARCAFDDRGNLYISDCFRKRIEFPEQRRYLLARMSAEPDTEHGVEAPLHGYAFIQQLRRDVGARRSAFRAVHVIADKFTRALAWANLAEEGKVFLVRGSWNTDFVDEACSFPNGAHDDQIDAVSLAVGMLARGRRRPGYGF